LTWREILVLGQRKVVKGPEGSIMTQLTLIGMLGFHLRLHFFHRGDGEMFHSHPRSFLSVCVSSAYRELVRGVPGQRVVTRGTITVRRATDVHNVEPFAFPCVTIAVTTPVIRQWEKFPASDIEEDR
jgi:hypothetical protein